MYLVSSDRLKQPFISPLSAAQTKAPSLRRRRRYKEEAAALTTPTIASTWKEVVYETPTHRSFPQLEEDDVMMMIILPR